MRASQATRLNAGRDHEGQIYSSLLTRMKRNEVAKLVQISLKNKYVFFAIPKNASSSIKYILQKFEYQGSPFIPTGKVHNLAASPLISTYQLPPEMIEDALTAPTYRRFVVVRHPVTRLLSCYLDRMQRPNSNARKLVGKWLNVERDQTITLEQFVGAICEKEDRELEQHFRPQADFIAHPTIAISDYIRFEQIREQLPVLLSELGMRNPPSMDEYFSPPATGADKKVREYFTSALLAKVKERYRSDFEAFGYDPIEI